MAILTMLAGGTLPAARAASAGQPVPVATVLAVPGTQDGAADSAGGPGALPFASQRQELVRVASQLLDEAQVSYVYGGSQLGSAGACQACNACLAEHHPAPSQRFRICGRCHDCSLDCSHFTELVYRQAGLPYPYLETARMQSLSPLALRERYQLVDVGGDVAAALPGDLLVYDGHVVMLERLRPGGSDGLVRGDLVHATGGRDLKGPGAGIQRERFADLLHFRGPMRRILRHARLAVGALPQAGLVRHPGHGGRQSAAAEPTAVIVVPPSSARPVPGLPPLGHLRPVVKRSGDDG